MNSPLRLLVAESEPPEARQERRDSVGRSSGETYLHVLKRLAPDAVFDRIKPADAHDVNARSHDPADYDGVVLTGSPLHLYEDTSETRRVVEFMRAVFEAGVPAFGSCAGLQVATVAAGGAVRPMREGREVAFARRITPTQIGATHPALAGRPATYDAPAVHSDEVAQLPEGAILLASNRVTRVQAAEIRYGRGVFWGVQYHPEISLHEVAAALMRQADDLLAEGFARDRQGLEDHADLIDRLGREPARRDLAWRLGLDEQVTDTTLRTVEISNFIERLVKPTRSQRGRA